MVFIALPVCLRQLFSDLIISRRHSIL